MPIKELHLHRGLRAHSMAGGTRHRAVRIRPTSCKPPIWTVWRKVPIRDGRLLQSPFAPYQSSAAVMAADLATTPATGIHVQACGDYHMINFGSFAAPERATVAGDES
jgi:hypothetical protein